MHLAHVFELTDDYVTEFEHLSVLLLLALSEDMIHLDFKVMLFVLDISY